MAAATDFIHDEEVVDAVLQYLCGVASGAGTLYPSGHAGTLPAAWKTKDHAILGLKLVEFGRPDWMALGAKLEYNVDGSIASADFSRVKDWCPALFVCMDRGENAGGGLGGRQDVTCPLKVVHLRWWHPDWQQSQCRTTTDKLGAEVVAGPTSWQNPDRARAHYAKIVCKALAHSRTLDNPTLTCADASARVTGDGTTVPRWTYADVDLPPDPGGAGGPIGVAIYLEVKLFVQ